MRLYNAGPIAEDAEITHVMVHIIPNRHAQDSVDVFDNEETCLRSFQMDYTHREYEVDHDAFNLIDRKIKAGEIEVRYFLDVGDGGHFNSFDELPDWGKAYALLRNPFLRTGDPEPPAAETPEEPVLSTTDSRRLKVTTWARDVAAPARFGMRVAMETALSTTVPVSAFRAAWVHATVSAAGSDEVLESDTAWAELEANMAVDMGLLEGSITRNRASWDAIQPHLTGNRRNFYMIVDGVPTASTTILWPSLEAGKQFADEIIFSQ